MTTEFIPRDYQAAGIELIQREDGCALLYEPGSGKTVTALTALRPPYLVVAPKMVAQEVWHRECAKWDHLAHLQVFHIDSSVFDYYRKVTASAIWGSEQREIVRGLVREKKAADALESWAQDLRSRAYVEYREAPQP